MNGNTTALCDSVAGILQLVGYVLTIFKIVIPLLIVFLGVFDFGKAVTSGKQDDIKKNAQSLMHRAIAGIIIFFVPTIVLWLFGFVAAYNDDKNEVSQKINYDTCQTCLLHPGQCPVQ